jgi:hypothetical protein
MSLRLTFLEWISSLCLIWCPFRELELSRFLIFLLL